MSNASAAYYAYLAQADRKTVKLFRNFGYFASADYVERRAERYERRAELESKEAPQDEPTGPLGLPIQTEDDSSDLHTTPEGYEEPPA